MASVDDILAKFGEVDVKVAAVAERVDLLLANQSGGGAATQAEVDAIFERVDAMGKALDVVLEK